MQNILVCDDDKQIVEAISIYLTGEGFHVLKAYDGFDALKIMEKEALDLLILDVMMPGLDGIRTTLKIREKIEIDSRKPKYLKVVWGVGYKIEKQGKTEE